VNVHAQNLPTETIQLLEEAERLAFARRLTDALRPIEDLSSFYSTVSGLLAEHFQCNCAWFINMDEARAEMVISGERRADDLPCMTGRYPIRHLAFLFRALEQHQPFACNDTGGSAALDEPDKTFFSDHGIRSFIAAPLIVDSRLTGCILCANGQAHSWNEQDTLTAREAAQVVEDGLHRIDLQRDATEHARAEQRAKEQLRLRDEFIGNAAHELKTPLTSIHAYGQLLEEEFKGRGDQGSARLMRRLNSQVARLYGLVADLVDTTRIAAGQLLLKKERFDLGELIREQAEELQLITDKHSMVLELNPLPSVLADRERIAQVITNLVSNAIKYSPEASDIIISADSIAGGVEVTIKDHGMGIPSEAAEKIFDRFFRVDDPVVRTSSGMGIGLYICAAIIHAHGGSISVQSTPGEGSVFSFILPGEQ